MLNSVFSSESQTVAAPGSVFVPLPPNTPANTEKQLSLDLEFHNFDWV